MELKFKRLGDHTQPLPAYGTAGAAGLDICSNERHILFHGDRAVIGTGFAVEVPEGYELQCRSRSGLAANNGIMVLNSPGTIDSDYRGEIKVILQNAGLEHHINPRDRIAQLILAPVIQVEPIEVESLSDTTRGENGFGSTGL
jgi:dUTP pyrophosphatase